ncbi:hypothetical protein RSOLAG22IIIB_12389 [Rhizoctonia solani]|uniref:Uncharacterized protein n=1 Tax=Rhizoctonia solani TaxID=456999 RepID=A0A0K6GDP8_9AGAM|nr:hypothetical protein RSOLAG22IIIB_12389 [Rhizoctonia solani]
MSSSSSDSESSSSSSSSSSSPDSKPASKPSQSYRPFQVSGVRAPSSAQPSTASKHATNTVRQPPSMKTKPNAPFTLRDAPILELASRNKAKGVTVIHRSDGDSSSLPESPFSPIRQRIDTGPALLNEDEPKHLRTAAGRTKAQLERDVNTVRGDFEGYQAQVNKQLDRMEDRQARFEKQQESVLEKLDMLIDRSKAVPALQGPIVKNEEPASTGFYATAKDIQKRRDRDKAVEKIPSEHKAQAVAVAKSGLGGVRKLTSDAPEFYYKHGQPDYFPARFTGDDGYCKPYPHWDKSFSANHHWFSAFITLWRSMAPQDGSEFAVACKKFTDRQILVLLHDGPFSSLSQAWRRENNSEHVQASKTEKDAKKRGGGRLDSKTILRLQYRPEIPQVAGPEWDATWSKQVMSTENTDDEGGKEFNDMLVSIDDDVKRKELAKPGVHRPFARRTIKLVDSDPPVIYSGKGKDKKLVLYPRAMFSRTWRKSPRGKAWMKASTHLINNDLKRKPDVSAFLKAHPPLESGTAVVTEDLNGNEVAAYEGGDEGEGEVLGGVEVEVKGKGKGKGKGEVEDEDEVYGKGEGARMDCTESGHNTRPVLVNMLTGDEIEIDPQLLNPPQAESEIRRPQPRVANTADLTGEVPTDSAANGHPPYSESSTQQQSRDFWAMPPPPPLYQQNIAAPATEPTEKKKKRTRAKVGEHDAPGPSSTAEYSNPSNEPPKKRRGRPPGSKNKKTIEKERLAAEENRKG